MCNNETDDTDPPAPALAPDPVDEVAIDEAELAPQNPDAPPEFRELLALTLKTTKEDVIAAAEACFVGRFPSVHAFIIQRITDHVPPYLNWILGCLDPARTLAGYEGRELIIWTITLDENDVLVFESYRNTGRTQLNLPGKHGERVTAFAGRLLP